MNVVLREPWTTERFLTWEDAQEGRFEFDGRQVREVTGGSLGHQRITTNIVQALEDVLDLARFEVAQEVRLQVGDQIRYPDVLVAAGPLHTDVRTLRDAIVLFEIVSPDSGAIDFGEKRGVYVRLPSISRYVIVEQAEPLATVLTWTRQAWSETTEREALAFPELGITVPLAGLYRNLRLPRSR